MGDSEPPEIIKGIREDYEVLRKRTTKELEDEHRELLQHMVFSKESYYYFNGYYFTLISELFSRYALEKTEDGELNSFERARKYNELLQDILDKD